MKERVLIGLVSVFMLLIPNAVFATGVRHDSGDDATAEEHECWINGYDSGFAGKYDRDRARECVDNSDNYNKMWAFGCEESTRTEAECGELINNPIEVEDFGKLKAENDRTCYDAGAEDGKADRSFDEERQDGCYEFEGIGDGYTGGYQFGCETHTAESTCELRYEDERYYCPDHPDVAGCADFLLNNSTYKQKIIIENYDINACKNANATCYEDINPENYCLETDNPVFCKSIGDLCDKDGFVKPEYPYCTEQVK